MGLCINGFGAVRRFFRGPWDYVLAGAIAVILASMLFALGVVHGRTQARLAHERSCGDHWECRAQALGYVVAPSGRKAQ